MRSNVYSALLTTLLDQSNDNNDTILNLIEQLNENHNQYMNTVHRLADLIQPRNNGLIDLSGSIISDISGNTNTNTNTRPVNTNTRTVNTNTRTVNTNTRTVQYSTEPIHHTIERTALDLPINFRFLTMNETPNTDSFIRRYTKRIKYEREESNGEDVCPITRTPFEDGEEILEICVCKHRFRTNAIMSWLRNHDTCPVCRMNIDS